MTSIDKLVSQYENQWYSHEEAQEVEKDLQKNSGTGDRWHWEDSKGKTVNFSG